MKMAAAATTALRLALGLVPALALALALGLAGPARAAEPPALPPAATPTAAPVTTTVTAAPAGVEVRIFNMGQADAMLISGPDATVLVDCGVPNDGPKDVHKRVLEELKRRQKLRLDALIITHFHSDHLGEDADHDTPKPTGAFALLAEGVSATAILDHGDAYPECGEGTRGQKQWAAAMPRWKEKGVYQERRVPKPGERLALGGGASLRFVAVNGNGVLEKAEKAGRFEGEAQPSENDYSISFVLESGDFELFSGGDLSGEDTQVRVGKAGKKSKRRKDVYNDIETVAAPVVGNVEVLRVNHHGSPHSTNALFVKTLRPEISIISCGEKNPYHHPAIEVVERLAPYGRVFVTSGLATDWRGREDAPPAEGDITISIAPGGASYVVKGKSGEIHKGRSFSDVQELEFADHPEMAPKPPPPPVEAPKPPVVPVPAGSPGS